VGGAEDWKTKVSVVECGFFWGGCRSMCLYVGVCVCMDK